MTDELNSVWNLIISLSTFSCCSISSVMSRSKPMMLSGRPLVSVSYGRMLTFITCAAERLLPKEGEKGAVLTCRLTWRALPSVMEAMCLRSLSKSSRS